MRCRQGGRTVWFKKNPNLHSGGMLEYQALQNNRNTLSNGSFGCSQVRFEA